jgi:trehalose 6-phosphate synthase
MWTKEDLQQLVREQMSDYLFVVVSNRQPYVHVFDKGKIQCRRGVGGVITSLDPVMQTCDGLWVAFGAGDADRKVTDKNGRLRVPVEDPHYTLKRVWLSKEEENGYYYGYSNEALWPLCHMAFTRPVFRDTDWEYYAKVNKKFADAILDEIGNNKAFVWIQDYHMVLLPKYLREAAASQLIIAHFWHIPWPNHEVFRICPQKKEILEGMLSNDLMGFHIRYHCGNFIDTVDHEIECKIDRERHAIIRGDHETLVRPFPISVDFDGINKAAQLDVVTAEYKRLKEEFSLHNVKVIIGVDRLDYTKGIPERLMAVDRLLEKHPGLKERIVFLQMGVISRIHISSYKRLNDEINALVEQINWKHSTDNWKPVILVRRYRSFHEMLALYRLADVCVVSSLHDGMNLVSKEFIATRSDNDGVLVLSQFTGSARELGDAVLMNPFDKEQSSDGILKALSMPKKERTKRMKKMRQIIQESNIYRWSGKVLSELLKFEFKE